MEDAYNQNTHIVPLPCAVGSDKLNQKNGCFTCGDCDRKILDFRGKNSEQIEQVLKGQEEACIIIDDDRDPYLDHQIVHKLRVFLIASVLVFGATLYSNAQEIEERLMERYEIVQKDTSQLYGFQFHIFPRLKKNYGGRNHRFKPDSGPDLRGRVLKKVDRLTVDCDSLGFEQTYDDAFMDEDGWLFLDLSDLKLHELNQDQKDLYYLTIHIEGYHPIRVYLYDLKKGKSNSKYIFNENRKIRYRRRVGTFI